MLPDRQVGVGLLAFFLVTSGCLGVLTGTEPLEFSAEQATVTDSALSETGYELAGARTVGINRTFEAGGESREVHVTNYLTEYQRTLDLGIAEGNLSVFSLFATPQVNVLGRTFNPVGEMSNRQLLKRAQSRYENVEVGAKIGSTEVRTLGTEATVDTFEGTARVAGLDVEILIHVTKVKHDGDFVIAIGAHPKRIPGEKGRILTLVRNINHEG